MGKNLTIPQVAEMLSVSRETIYRYIRLGLLELSKPRSVRVVSVDSIEQLLEETTYRNKG